MNSIRTKGMIFSLSLIVISVFILGVSSYNRFKTILVDEVDDAVVRVAEESADHLSNYIAHFIEPLAALADNEDIKSMDFERQKAVINSQINPSYLNIAVVNMNKHAYYMDGNILDLSDREYLSETLEGRITFSEVITSRMTGTPVIMVGVPISDAGIIKGALIVRLDVDFLSNFANTRGYGHNGRAYVITPKGCMISRPEQEKTESFYCLPDLIKIDDRYGPFVEFVKQNEYSRSGYGRYMFDNKRILMGYASVEETNWKIYIGTNEDDALANLIGLRRMFTILTIITLAACILTAWIFISRFSKSITELDELFDQGAKGNLTMRFTPKSKDELSRVGISFNRMMDKIKTLTLYDPLTALRNQYVFEKDIDMLVQSEEHKVFSLIMIAIDKFSFIIDTYGYTAGDNILVEVAARINHCVGSNSQVYRYKGDEFVILCINEGDEASIAELAKNVLVILKEPIHANNKDVELNISIGTFIWSEESRAEVPIKAVTHAKNYAKYLGSNQIQKFNSKIYKELSVMNELQADIVNGLKEDQFFLVYQPLYYLTNENIAEVEALIRWKHPDKGLLYPDQFIELAEQSGTIVNIDQWVIESACKQLKSWKDNNKSSVKISVNISTKTFETTQFISNVIKLLQNYNVDPSLLQFEITERMLIRNVEDSINRLKELRAMGINVAIDDFGSGYSSLNYIVRLPIDSIKIDKSFVQNIHTSKEAKTIVATIIHLCKTLKLKVIAEGIESELELDYLKSNECDIGQGYYFSRPITITEVEKKLIGLT